MIRLFRQRSIIRFVLCFALSAASAGLRAEGEEGDVVFEKRILTAEYLCDGIRHGDLNNDGHQDIVAGPYWYEGPEFVIRQVFYEPRYHPAEASPSDSMFSYVYDFSQDGWPDILVLGRVHKHSAYWYENPQGREVHWKRHFAFHRVKGESPPFVDLDGDGRPELVAHWQGRWGMIQPNWKEPTAPWSFQPITRQGDWNQFYHGTGVGDVNGDGLTDLILNDGWWEQPAPTVSLPHRRRVGVGTDEWIEHPHRFAQRGGAQMFAYDVDGDGDNDVITSLDAHGWGLAWFENVDGDGGIDFVEHRIMGTREELPRFGVAFSQPHALALADVNGDGLKDIVTGKRRWAHGPAGDVEPNADPVLYWFELTRPRDGTVRYVPHRIDSASGVGVQLTTADVNDDGATDLLTASKLGAFVFLNRRIAKLDFEPEVAVRPDEKPRLLVLTDIGGDPDDTQSMIRLMTYANEFEIEGLIASASGTPGEIGRAVVQPHLIREVVSAYGQVCENLRQHAPGYSSPEELLQRIKRGNPNRRLEAIGDGHDTEGSRWIIHCADSDDPRPLNVAIWGGQTDLAQALWRVREDRGTQGLEKFISKLRVHDIADQDGIFDWLSAEFPGSSYVLDKAPEGRDKREAAFRGMYLGGDEAVTSPGWLDEHVRQDHGPLGALYPSQTWTAPNPHGALKEGDTPSWFYFLANGLQDPSQPTWGGWGGRFQPSGRGHFVDAQDTVDATRSARATVWRWRRAFQNAFQARMDWCVEPFSEANHPPVAVIFADSSRRIVHRKIAPGDSAPLDARGSSDPDGDELTYRWWVYKEASGHHAPDVAIDSSDRRQALLRAPADTDSGAVHIILEVTDAGSPPLTSYRRVVFTICR